MDAEKPDEQLNAIDTAWTLVAQAHQGSASGSADAQARLLTRYGGAVHRYLLGAMRDPEAADELFQEFSLRFLRGDFRNAKPERGRFRDYLKSATYHLIVDFQRRRKQQPLSLGSEIDNAALPDGDADRTFLTSWREELMNRAWLSLKEAERYTGVPYYTTLRCRTDHPLVSSAELADKVGELLGKTFSSEALRQLLHRARERYTDELLHKIAESLEESSPEQLAQELIELGLLSYCQSALKRRAGS